MFDKNEKLKSWQNTKKLPWDRGPSKEKITTLQSPALTQTTNNTQTEYFWMKLIVCRSHVRAFFFNEYVSHIKLLFLHTHLELRLYMKMTKKNKLHKQVDSKVAIFLSQFMQNCNKFFKQLVQNYLIEFWVKTKKIVLSNDDDFNFSLVFNMERSYCRGKSQMSSNSTYIIYSERARLNAARRALLPHP